MVYVIVANRIKDKSFIGDLTFGERDPLADEFCKLMGVTRTTIRKVYTEKQLVDIWKQVASIVSDPKDKKMIKEFLSACIEDSKGSNVDILFH